MIVPGEVSAANVLVITSKKINYPDALLRKFQRMQSKPIIEVSNTSQNWF
ncbi:MAG: hypothetical protein BAJALOKI2v1_860010 [Promethearchaeota archaeon]|nr:MAG: hypothetical protein BAJALOKI2v1_860010 [Candidatus Lokiarchaeota archaeon]